MVSYPFLPDNYDSFKLGSAEKLCREGRIKVTDLSVLENGHIKVTGKSSDSFNFINHPSVVLDVSHRRMISCACECAERRKSLICVHCAALAIEAGSDAVLFSRPAQDVPVANKPAAAPIIAPIPEPAAAPITEPAAAPVNVAVQEPVIAPAPKEEIPADEIPANEIPADELPANEIPADEIPDNLAAKGLTEEEPSNTPAKETAEPRSMNIVFGNTQEGESLVWLPNDTEQSLNVNMGIIGTMGTGKTQLTKSIVTQLVQNASDNYDGSPLNILIFDYKGDYNETKPEFVNAVKARVLKPYMLPFNPLAIYKRRVKMPVLPAHTANAFVDTVVKMCRLGPKQRETLLSCILKTYEAYGIDKGDERTWSRVAPTFKQVYELFSREYDSRDSLSSIMNKLHNFSIFEERPLYALPFSEVLKGTVVIDISGYEKDMQDLIVAVTLDQFYSCMYAMGSSRTNGRFRQLTNLILVDEADSLMSKNFVTLKNILKEGREFGAGIILSTQFLSHFGTGTDTYSSYISTWIVHNVSDLSDKDVESILGVKQKQNSPAFCARIRALQKHQSIVKMMNSAPAEIRDLAFWQLMAAQE